MMPEMPEWLHCKTCGHEVEVSIVDPDSSLDDMHGHLKRRHPGIDLAWHDLVGEGRAA